MKKYEVHCRKCGESWELISGDDYPITTNCCKCHSIELYFKEIEI